MHTSKVCVVPRLRGVGGMVSFQERLATGLESRGVEVCYDLSDWPYAVVLVLGGTRRITGLWRAKKRGVPIVQRLDGMNWLHRLRWTNLRHYLRAEYGNRLLRLIRARLADRVVYQSHFARRWWERVYGPASVPSSVVYNGVDLTKFTPEGPQRKPEDRIRILLVEGNLMGGYELGLEHAFRLADGVADRLISAHSHYEIMDVELLVVGRLEDRSKKYIDERMGYAGVQPGVRVRYVGLVPHERIPELDRSAHLLFSADLNAACPNSVIEAMACGTPVVAFDTGALRELVEEEAGVVVPYGGDPWRLDPPNFDGLAQAAIKVLENLDRYRNGARARAEAAFGLETMVHEYLKVLLPG